MFYLPVVVLMADIDNILSKLEKLKGTGNGNGNGKWLACCPVHEDKSPSLAIKLTGDDKTLIHCFAGCDVTEIVGALGLTLADLMPNNPDYKKGNKPPKFNKFELFDRIAFESIILLVAIRQFLAGTTLTETDLERVIKAENTIDDIVRECGR